MCNFKNGQRIKKVRGVDGIGTCGVVIAATYGVGRILVQCDRPWRGSSTGTIYPRTKPAPSFADLWEPLTPSGAAPSEYTFRELMDRLKAGEVERV